MKPHPLKVQDELKQFHEAEAAKLRAAIASATEDQQKHLSKAIELHEGKLKAFGNEK